VVDLDAYFAQDLWTVWKNGKVFFTREY